MPDKRISTQQTHASTGRPSKKVKKVKSKAGSSTDEVLLKDIFRLKESSGFSSAPIKTEAAFVRFEPFEVDILKINSSGDGMGFVSGYTAIVPFTIGGDRVVAKPYFINEEEKILLCDLEEVVQQSALRDDALVSCKYFGKCSGCQLQALSYDQQLLHKQNVVKDAFKNFCNVNPDLIPAIGTTIGSPLQYGYRTKITPHFDLPRRGFPDGEYTQIGFNQKGRRKVLDIEECPIATDPLNRGLRVSRKQVHENLQSYKRGATLLLRQNSSRLPDQTVEYSCITDSKEIITEYIDHYTFQSPAGAFFQNNNAIMPLLTQYVKKRLRKPKSDNDTAVDRYLVDAYCGSGLFSISCSEGFTAVSGVEISQDSVKWARVNAQENQVTNATFLAGSAEALFADITFPPSQTSMILDPPRKGCDAMFLDQLLRFSPDRIVYVSCCVQTQARDIGYILNNSNGSQYKVMESIRGFDLFPQTYHVEGVVVLQREAVVRAIAVASA